MLPIHIKEAIEHYIPKMIGMTPVERCCEMAELILEVRPKLVVEIGVFGGVTTIAQAFALRSLGSGIVYGVDSWKVGPAIEGENTDNEEWWKKIEFRKIYQGAVDAVWDHHLEDWCVLLRAMSQDVASLFQDIDILNIDGCHSEVASCRDVRLYLPRVRKGGHIWMDDCDWKSTRKAQELLGMECNVLRVGEGGHYKLYQKR